MANEVRGSYITCAKHHKLFVVWVEEKQRYAFTCDECKTIAPVAESVHGVIELTLHAGATLGRRIA